MSCTNNLFTTEITSNNLGICEPSNVYFWVALVTVFFLQIGRHILWTYSGKNHRELMSLSISERNKRCDLFGRLELIQFGKSAAYAISIILLVSGNGWVIISHIIGDFVGSWIAFHMVNKDKKHLIKNIIEKYEKIKKSTDKDELEILKNFIVMIQELNSSSESRSNIKPGEQLMGFSNMSDIRF